jgi:membrane protein required for beta-lactamase induction
MSPQLCFFASIGFSLVAWAIVVSRYFWPRLRPLPGPAALRPILILHSFRFIGLAFLVPGVVSPELPSTFAHLAAYGDIVAATLALLSLAAPAGGLGAARLWIFNQRGPAELIDAL